MANAQAPPPYEESSPAPTPLSAAIPVPVVLPIESKPNDRFVNSFWHIDIDIREAFYYFSIINWLTTLPMMYLGICYGVFAIPFAYNLFITICATHNNPACLKVLVKISLGIQVLMWTIGPIYVIYFSIVYRDISKTVFGLFGFGLFYFLYATMALWSQIDFATNIRTLVLYERRLARRLQ